MKKANILDNNQEYKGFILIETLTELWDFYDEKTFGLMKESAVNLVNRAMSKAEGKTVSHAVEVITIATEKLNERQPKGIIYRHAELMGTYQVQLEKAINEGRILAINPVNMVSWFTLSENATYEIISEKENYTQSDIKILRWDGGTHWYAKVGLIDVVIDGEQKWNARHIAQQKAEEYLKTL